ncbi:MAG: ABC transporter permease [Clostridiales bacterium]|nr:ABC transporter permease [Clostridiales bacterium]
MFKYSLKKTLSNRMFIFWSFVFPVTLMFFFHLAFSTIYAEENTIDPRDVGIIYEADNQFTSFFGSVTDQIEVLNEIDEDEDTLYELLGENEIDGIYIVKEDSIEVALCPKYSETDAMIIKTVADFYIREFDLIEQALTSGDMEAVQNMINSLNADTDYMSQETGIYKEQTNPYNWYYYATIVMGIMFQAMAGVNLVAELQADVGERKVAMRSSVSPASKSVLVLTAFLSRLLVSLVISSFSIFCMNRFFEIPVGNRLPQLLLFILASNMFSLSMGEMFGLFFKGPVQTRGNKGVALIMTSVFLSGEMIATLPGMFERYLPIVNDVNPATVLNLALYRLVYYEDLTSFYVEIVKIVLLTILFLTIATMRLRRQKYASL